MKQRKLKAKRKQPTLAKHILFILASTLFFCFVLGIGTGFFLLNFHTTPQKSLAEKVIPTPTQPILPTPTIDMSLANTFKIYVSSLYGFTVTYPALGEDRRGHIIFCGDNIEELTTQNTREKNTITLPTIRIDSLYQITLHPWGSQLADYLSSKDPMHANTVQWVRFPNVDEAVFFSSTNQHSYFADVFALYKKGNLIYQLEKSDGYQAGCQMLFNPKDYNQTLFAPQDSQNFQTLLFDQYKNWNEATSIQFSK